MRQYPKSEAFLLKWRGDQLTVELKLDSPRKGHAAFRTNLGNARVRRHEIIAETERGEVPLARAWSDLPMKEVEIGLYRGVYTLDEVGVFSGKPCFFPEGERVPEWPEGRNFHIKVESAETVRNNSIYTVFPRQFGSFREIVRRLPLIMDQMGFRIIQTLPPFPVPTTYAVMGEYGCPFAALDFFSVDPAMAEFDEAATPIDQFRELIDAVHARKGLFFVDLPANHTGWASTLQTHHPDWFNHEADGRFHSPGAWGVKWADLVELDYANPQLRAYMAEVFLFWCRNGVDGFRCDAGYMIPLKTWEYIVARVREEYPDTVFMLEGLGGELKVTDALLAEANLDWAYSEIFQTYDRGQFEWYLPGAIERSEKFGTLVHFAETHDNDRLAKSGETYARLRVQLAALLSWQGAWGIANGVEWLATEKIDVHGKNDLNWGSERNMVELIARLNFILANNPAFARKTHLKVVTQGEGNTLAVTRDDDDASPCLILANLDCAKVADIAWDRAAFPYPSGMDLVTERMIALDGRVHLEPGEVLCVQASARVGSTLKDEFAVADARAAKARKEREALFHWVYPRDVKREAVVPENQLVEVSAPYHFRVRISDPLTGRTLRVYRSQIADGRHIAVFDAPHYKGDGTSCRRLEIMIVVYEPGCAKRMSGAFLIPPRSRMAKAKLAFSGEEVRREPTARAVLSNGAGAAAQMRSGWGTIASQYDAILAANPNPRCPGDRLTLWTRTRCWLQREGYTRELNEQCMTKFSADPSGRYARWEFRVPCGMGKTASFEFSVGLSEGENAARVQVRRIDGGEGDVGDQVRLVFRPDLEWRSFHATTKAYRDGTEERFMRAAKPTPDGFTFAPFEGQFTMTIDGGEYHHEGAWEYNVAHPEELERGQDGAGDLFSPGWISADMAIDGRVVMTGVFSAGEMRGTLAFAEPTGAVATASIPETLKRALEAYVVRRDELKTVIAGYPWFLDWGRDTFIFMRGMIAAGRYEDSMKILKAFAAFEENGTLPNIIYGGKAGNRDTTDAQLWFIRCVKELEEKHRADFTALREACESIVDNYIKGTPNGIRMDRASGLIWSPSHFTWMDTNYPACTPRAGYPIEIEALWISALHYLGRHELAARALASVKQYFAGENGYADCLDAPNGESAAAAKPDFGIRPNQLFLITLGVLEDKSILRATEELLVPGGIRSLNAGDGRYRGSYTGDEDTSRKVAYHNGTVWAWPFPLYAEALMKMKMCPKEVAMQLLAGAVENLNHGTVGHLSENADGDAPHRQKGCTAQAWSDSELLRVWLSK